LRQFLPIILANAEQVDIATEIQYRKSSFCALFRGVRNFSVELRGDDSTCVVLCVSLADDDGGGGGGRAAVRCVQLTVAGAVYII
jgi:hypothetical protein